MHEMNRLFMIRLKNEYEKIQKIPENDMIEIRPAPGQTPPYVQRYHVTYNVPTWVRDGDRIVKQARTTVEITRIDLCSSPHTRVVEGRVPFHPNWFESGTADNGCAWRMDMWLYEYMHYIGDLLRFKPERVDIHSPSNQRAKEFWLAHRDEPGMFPTDDRPFPRPEDERKTVVIVQPTKEE